MRVLVTGASGSLGSSFVAKLANRANVKSADIELFATDIKSPKVLDSRITFKQFDIRDPKFLSWVSEIKPDVIVHLASILQISRNVTRQMAYEIDVEATKVLLTKAVELDCQKFVVTTSGAAYGYYPRNLNTEITEDWSLLGNEDYFYSDHKRQIENLLGEFKESAPQLQQVVFRPGAILGPNFEGPVVDLFQQSVITGLMGYDGLFNFIWSEDVVDYLIEAVTTEVSGHFNIAGEGAISLKQIAKLAGKPYLPLPSPFIQAMLTILKPLGLTQYGPEQVKFIKYRPVLSSSKIRARFKHQPRFNSEQTLNAYLKSNSAEAK